MMTSTPAPLQHMTVLFVSDEEHTESRGGSCLHHVRNLCRWSRNVVVPCPSDHATSSRVWHRCLPHPHERPHLGPGPLARHLPQRRQRRNAHPAEHLRKVRHV